MFQLSITLNTRITSDDSAHTGYSDIDTRRGAWDSRSELFFNLLRARFQGELNAETATVVFPTAKYGSIELEGALFFIFKTGEGLVFALNLLQSGSFINNLVRQTVWDSYGANSVVKNTSYNISKPEIIRPPESQEPLTNPAPLGRITQNSFYKSSGMIFLIALVVGSGIHLALSERSSARAMSLSLENIQDSLAEISAPGKCPSVTVNNNIDIPSIVTAGTVDEQAQTERIRIFRNGRESE